MARRTLNYDVFLSYTFPLPDASQAATVRTALSAAGFLVFDPSQISPGGNLGDKVLKALAESAALVAVITGLAPSSPSTLTAIGAASAWGKHIYLIQGQPFTGPLPSYLNRYPVYPLDRIDDLINAIRIGLKPLTKEEQERLTQVYASINSSVDHLMADPVLVHELATEFNKRRNVQRSGERLIRELLQLRKQGRLSRIAAMSSSSSSSSRSTSSSSSSSSD